MVQNKNKSKNKIHSRSKFVEINYLYVKVEYDINAKCVDSKKKTIICKNKIKFDQFSLMDNLYIERYYKLLYYFWFQP
jgi:hypothetical protein